MGKTLDKVKEICFSTPIPVAFERPWPTTRRGLALWLFGVAFVFIGLFNYVLSDYYNAVPQATYDSLAFALLISQGSVMFWGFVLMFNGAVAMFCSYCHFGRDKIGYMYLSSFCAGWATVYFMGLLFGASTRTVGGAVIWLLFAGVLLVIAGFPNISTKAPPLSLAADSPRAEAHTEVPE